jgi:hypothetical protein
MRDGLIPVKLGNTGLNLPELPFFSFDISGNRLRRKE